MKITHLSLAAAIAAFAVAACAPDANEKAGERADSAIEEATQGRKNLGDGPLENAGEAVDQARRDAGEAAREAGETVDRRTDGDANTK